MGRFLRSVSARDLAFWRAFERSEGPIGYGPLLRIAAWLGWTQFDTRKVAGPELLIDWLAAFVEGAGDEDDADDEPLTAGEIDERREQLTAKVMRMFRHPQARTNAECRKSNVERMSKDE